MKKYFILAIAFILGICFNACSSDDEMTQPKSQDLTFTAYINQDVTRTNIDNTGKVAWVAGDRITIGTNNIVFVATPDANDARIATFKKLNTTDDDPIKDGDNYVANYGDVNNQVYSSTAAGANCPMTASSETTTLAFTNTCGVMKINVNANGVSISSVKVSNAADTYTLTCSTPVAITDATDFYVALPEGDYTNITFTTSDNDVCVKTASSAISIQTNHLKPITFNAALTFDIQAVDLGLPSGTKWATCNVGTKTYKELGEKYSWGEVGTKSSYKDDNYKWVDEEWTIFKYNTDASWDVPNSVYDNKSVLEAEDDAASVRWGGNWRMPTKEEWAELVSDCTWKLCAIFDGELYEMPADGWSDFHTKYSYYSGSKRIVKKVISTVNDNYILLPLAENLTTDTYYWSSTLGETLVSYASCCMFKSQTPTSSGCTQAEKDRYEGYYIRPVLR